jgi:hypothetical protein
LELRPRALIIGDITIAIGDTLIIEWCFAGIIMAAHALVCTFNSVD